MLTQLITDLQTRINNRELIELTKLVKLIPDLTDDLTPLSSVAIGGKVCTAKQWFIALAVERNRRQVTNILGSYPTDASDFVSLYARTQNIQVAGNGIVTRFNVMTGRTESVIEPVVARDARITADTFDLKYHPRIVDDCVSQYIEVAREARAREIVASVRHVPTATFDWNALVVATIDLDGISAEFAAANLQHFIWQVKRKQAGLPIDNHLMVIIGGAQNVGKSTFAKMLFKPVDEITSPANFTEITDERNISLWRYSVIFMDEMAFASGSDCDAVKNVITADRLMRRPMRTNSDVQIEQRSTFIGTTNKNLDQMIRDTTGARRFSMLTFLATPNRTVINAADYMAAWQSVDESAVSPIVPHLRALTVIQDEQRRRSPVEQWIDTIVANGGTRLTSEAGEVVAGAKLHADYLRYQDDADIPTRDRLDRNAFISELKRLSQNTADPMWRFKRTATANGFTYTGPTNFVGERVFALVNGKRY